MLLHRGAAPDYYEYILTAYRIFFDRIYMIKDKMALVSLREEKIQ